MLGLSHPEAGFGEVAWHPHSLERFPRPLADSYQRLRQETAKGAPVAVAWALRDAWECALRFVACLGLADLMRADPRSETLIRALSTLSKRNGLSLEDWVGLLAAGCDPAAVPVTQRLLPGLTMLPASGDGLPARLAQWRDRLFDSPGFAPDQHWPDQHWSEAETAALMRSLDGFYAALAPILDGWVLHEGGPDGPALMGCGQDLPAADLEPMGAHEHVAMGKAENVVLARADGASLAFGSLFWAQSCAVCAARQIFFCDKDDRAKAAPTHGRLREIRLPRSQRWERGAFDKEAIGEGERLLFRGFAAEYLRPDWIMDRLWQAAGEIRTGYIHLEGPAGTGKSFIARGMKQESGQHRGMPALLYHILPGERTDYRNFIMLLADEAREQFRARVQEIQSKDQTADGLRAQFREFLATLMQANGAARLILILDGLDELPSHDDGQFSLADFLIPASDLPPGCLILLTGRASLREGIARRIGALRAASGEGGYRSLRLEPAAPENRALLTRYAMARLPAHLGREALAGRVVEQSGGAFRYLAHLVQTLGAATLVPAPLGQIDELPSADRFYAAYLDALRKRVGDTLYEGVYRPLLLFLCAAQAPITIDQIKGWGLRGDSLRGIFLELADIIEEVRGRPWHDRVDDGDAGPRYRIAHAEFPAYVAGDPVLAPLLAAAHGRIATVIENRHAGHWDSLGIDDEADLYDASFVLAHEARAGAPGPASPGPIS
ncbi:MAG TPA: hypothetical protein VIE35_12915, partial [Dongiaceae bacterium]